MITAGIHNQPEEVHLLEIDLIIVYGVLILDSCLQIRLFVEFMTFLWGISYKGNEIKWQHLERAIIWQFQGCDVRATEQAFKIDG